MRLHRLAMTAIGPFTDRVEIDFARLGESGLFLLEGPTGSGKSTVIDAISFALYGKVAQASADGERLRSHHADPRDEPVVELIFETQSGLFRIRRTPSFERPKKSGNGTTKVNATVKIWRITSPDVLDGGEPLSTRIAEADDEIVRAVGLSHDQFVQTVVLPQGEFANFLRAGTDAKKALLQKLFGTEVLARTQAALVEARQQAEKRRAAAAALVGRATHSFIGAVEAGDDDAARLSMLADSGDDAELIAATDQVLAGLGELTARAQDTHATATSERLRSDAVLRSAEDLLRRHTKRETVRRRHAALTAQQDEIACARDELAAAERALTVVSAAEALASAIAHSEAAQDLDSSARAELPDCLSAADEKQLRAAAAQRRHVVGELTEDVRRERGLGAAQAERDLIQQHADALAQSIKQVRDELAELPAQVAARTDERELAAATAAQLPGLSAELQRAEQRLSAARRAVAAARIAAQDEQITQAALQAWEQQERQLSVLRTTRIASIAGELGLALKVGDPCAVCGSVEHPQPATPHKGHVSQGVLEDAEADLRRLHETAENCRRQLETQRREIAELQVAADQLSPELASSRVQDIGASVAAAREASARHQQLTAELAQLLARIGELTAQIRSDEVDEAGLLERSAAINARIVEDERLVAAARGGYPTVGERGADLAREADLLDRAAEATSTAAGAIAAALDSGTAFSAALDRAEFDGQQSWQVAIRGRPEIADLSERIRAFDDQWASALAALAEAELTDPALDATLPDLTCLQNSLRVAEGAESAAAAVHGSASARLASASRQAGALVDAAAHSATALRDTAPAIRLGNLAAGIGDNQLRMDLTTYVLVRRFADVVAAANSQLRRISGGRYELQHTSNRNGNARSGLGLLVLDLHTGRPREPGTLSGGETFYVSLSLALGLADVVRAESGGIDLGTLFIDEGFGSLDPEVLDEVLTVLDSLRAGGRVVGVVSHVAELKARVPDRITVSRRADGSSQLRITA
jgi:exonuclease SbcC